MTNCEYTHAADFDRIREMLLECTDAALGCVQELEEEEALKDCVWASRGHLEYGRHILQSNIMPMALFADSQAGKTTTVTIMADGRNMVPRGNGGFRTSTLPLTIYHDPLKTKIEISLYTQEELVGRILEAAGGHLENASGRAFSLDDPEDYQALKAALEKELLIYQQDRDYGADRTAILHNAILILHFYGCEAYRQLQENTFTTLRSVRKFLSFRTDLETCWDNLRTRGLALMDDRDGSDRPLFGELENLHVFVRSISVPVHSEFMRATGTAVIDAPGTKMSLEDTRRAINAARNAAVVLFLFKGERELEAADKELLTILHKAGLAEKVLFAVNFRKPVAMIRNDGIEKAILSSLRQAGYDAPQHQQLLYYNALWAVLAAQGRLILRGELDADTEAYLLREAERLDYNRRHTFTAAADAWKYLAVRALRNMDDDLADELNSSGITPEIIREMEQASLWHEMIRTLREFVLHNRAASVLNDLGARPLRNTLRDIENRLAMYEKDADSSEADAAAEYEAAKATLDAYVKEADQVIRRNFSERIDEAIARDYFEKVILGAVPDAAKAAAPEVYKATSLLNNLRIQGQKAVNQGKKAVNFVSEHLGLGQMLKVDSVEGVKKRCANIVKHCFEKELAVRESKWFTELPETPLYCREVKTAVERAKEELQLLWEKYGFNEHEMLRHEPALPVQITGDLNKDIVSVRQMFDTLNSIPDVQANISPELSSWLVGAGTYLGGTMAYIAIPGLIAGWIVLIAAVAATVLMAVLTFSLADGKKEKQIEQVRTELEKSLGDQIVRSAARDGMIRRLIDGKGGKTGLKFIRMLYESAFRMGSKKHYVELKDAYKRTLDLLRKNKAERDRIAALALHWRTERIAPLRSQAEEAGLEVERIWG